MPVRIVYVDKDDNEVTLDSLIVPDGITDAIRTIGQSHHEIHGGSSYTSCRVVTLPAGASANILITTLDSPKLAHIVYQVVSDDLLTVNFYEAPDYSGGTAMVAYNRYRDSNNKAGTALAYDATDDGGGKGTLIWTFKAGANKTVTASESARFEFILGRNKKYLLEGVGALNDNLTFLLDWYEHTNK